MSGDRHLRPDPEGRVGGSPPTLATVMIKTNAAHARSRAGQHLLQLLVNLLARQFGVVRDVLLDVPDVPLYAGVILVPRVNDGSLRDGLLRLGSTAGAGITRTRVLDASAPTVVVCVGTDLDPADLTVPAIAIWGSGWRMSARTYETCERLEGDSPNPLGPYLAACVGAGFAFKSAYGTQQRTRCDVDLWRESGKGPELGGIVLPSAYVLGLGAVGAALAHTLAAARDLRGCLVGVDPQSMSDTDSNRLLSGTSENVGTDKVDLFARMFVGSSIEGYTVRARWPDEYLADPARKIPGALRASEAALRFQWVLSCVDRDRDRVGIARALPRHVLSGSTFGMVAQTAYYSGEGDCECLGCHHQTPAQLGVEALAEQLRALDREGRDPWYQSYGATLQERASIEEYLSDPQCGGPGEADLARLGLNGRVDWAVGFVSVGAGVLLAARFIRSSVMGVDEEIRDGSELRYFFWSDQFELSRAKRATNCLICDGLADDWRELWH